MAYVIIRNYEFGYIDYIGVNTEPIVTLTTPESAVI